MSVEIDFIEESKLDVLIIEGELSIVFFKLEDFLVKD